MRTSKHFNPDFVIIPCFRLVLPRSQPAITYHPQASLNLGCDGPDRRDGARGHGASERRQVGYEGSRRRQTTVFADVPGRAGVLQLRSVRPGEPAGEREAPEGRVRFRGGGRRLSGRGGGQPAVGQPGMDGFAARGRRPRVGDHGRAGHFAVPARQQVRLEIQDAAGEVGVPGDEGPPVLLDPWQGDRRFERAQHYVVRAWKPSGLRLLGPARQPRLVI